MRYLLRFGTLDQVAQLFGTEWPDVQWGVRYFRIGEREELQMTLDKRGQLVRWHHSILREAPGASLSRDAALAAAREALRRERGLDPARETLVSESVTEEAQRRDHYFEFRREGWAWGESELRTSASVQGDEVVNISRWVKVPEAFEREEAKSGWRQLVAKELREWTSLAVFVLCGALFVLLIRKGITPWRLGFLAGLFPFTLQLIEAANHAPWFFSGYSTTTPLGNFLTKQMLGGLFGLVLGYLGSVVKISVALGVVAWAFAWTPRAFAHAIATDPRRRRIWRDALPLVLLTLAVAWAENALKWTVLGYWFPARGATFVVPGVDYAVPWLAKVVDALQSGLNTTLNHAIVAALVALGLRRAPRATIAALVLYPIAGAFSADTLADFAYSALSGELSIAVRVLLAIYVWRFNPLVIFSAYTASGLIYAISLFLEKGGPVYRSEGVILLAISIVGVMWLLLRKNRASGAQGAKCVPPPTHPPA